MVVRWQAIVLIVGLMLAVPCTAQAAGLLPGANAYNDGCGPDGGSWRGSVHFHEDMTEWVPLFGFLLPDEIDGNLEFAVFTAANFVDFLTTNGLPSPTEPVSGLVYAYQIDLITAIDSAGSPTGVGDFTVGINTDVPRSDIAYISSSGDKNPVSLADNDNSMLWGFNQTLVATEMSDILYYSSPNRPRLDNAQVPAGAIGFMEGLIPSPGYTPAVPEPSSLILIFSVMLTVVCCRRRPIQ